MKNKLLKENLFKPDSAKDFDIVFAKNNRINA
jgi:hypothetical protein